jgi:hypothetical protein
MCENSGHYRARSGLPSWALASATVRRNQHPRLGAAFAASASEFSPRKESSQVDRLAIVRQKFLEITIAALREAPLVSPASRFMTGRGRGGRFGELWERPFPSVTMRQAIVEMDMIAHRLEQQYPDADKDLGIELTSLRDNMVGGVRTILLVLLAAAT